MGFLKSPQTDWRRDFDKAWHHALGQADGALDQSDREVVRRDAAACVESWSGAGDGLLRSRTELMDSVDRGLVHEAVLELDDASREALRRVMPELPCSIGRIERLVAANELRIAALRGWARIHCGDFAKDDWFETYRRAARMRKSSTVRDLERLTGDAPAASRNNLDGAMKGVNTSLRLRLLQAPPGKAIAQRTGIWKRLQGLRHAATRNGAGEAAADTRFLP